MLGVALAPCLPSWLVHERERDVQIDEGVVNCVGFIGQQSKTGFIADGTCFCVSYEIENESFFYLVTARHLIRPFKFPIRRGEEEYNLDTSINIRFSRKENLPRVIPTRRGDWRVPVDKYIDLAIAPWDHRQIDPNNELDMHSLFINGPRPVLLTEELAKMHGPIRIGDEIFIPSTFPGHTGERRNIPVARVGNIAAPPLEVVRDGSPTAPAYLIETKSLGGTSGAPVFLHLAPHQRRGMPTHDPRPDGSPGFVVPYALIGMVLGAHGGQYAADFVRTDKEENIIGRDSEFNAGISVVLPVAHITQLLEREDMKAAREASLEAIKRNSGYRPSSNRPSVSHAPLSTRETDENPAHREDFTRLVGAAAKRKPKGDRT